MANRAIYILETAPNRWIAGATVDWERQKVLLARCPLEAA